LKKLPINNQEVGLSPPLIVIAAGVCAALHVGKLPPAIGALQHALDMSLVQAGFLLSLVQLAGMAAGIAFGAWADSIGLRRSMMVGLSILALASAAGGLAGSSEMLLMFRAVEGFGFLLVVLS
jgi:MFS transporter, CP family, cyanate transporter